MAKKRKFSTPVTAEKNHNEHQKYATEICTEEDIATCSRVLSTLLTRPSRLRLDPALKPIRVSLFSLLKSLSLSSQSSNNKLLSTQQLSCLVSDALDAEKWNDAIVTLDAMRDLKRTPRLGSIQRWVARCAENQDIEMRNALMAGVLSLCGEGVAMDPQYLVDGVCRLPNWNHWKESNENQSEDYVQADWNFVKVAEEDNNKGTQHVTVHVSSLSASQVLSMSETQTNVQQNTSPTLMKECISLNNVLSSGECKSLINAAEQLSFAESSGYTFHQDTRGAAGCVWLMDTVTCQAIFNRISPFIPALNGESVGLNARFRFYKYTPGAVYKPHVDGAWPASGLLDSGDYKFDVSDGALYSRMTLLIYLNDSMTPINFQDGETVFYRVSQDGDALVSEGVSPRAGCCLLFPHGEASAGIVHEGSAVTEGCKYIIRSDVLYRK